MPPGFVARTRYPLCHSFQRWAAIAVDRKGASAIADQCGRSDERRQRSHRVILYGFLRDGVLYAIGDKADSCLGALRNCQKNSLLPWHMLFLLLSRRDLLLALLLLALFNPTQKSSSRPEAVTLPPQWERPPYFVFAFAPAIAKCAPTSPDTQPGSLLDSPQECC